MCIVATTSTGVQQSTGFAAFCWGAKVVWNIRLKGSIFCLLGALGFFALYQYDNPAGVG
jgi:hypothetical protein